MRQLDIFEFLEMIEEAAQQSQREEEQEERDAIQEEAEERCTSGTVEAPLYRLMHDELCRRLKTHNAMPRLDDIEALELAIKIGRV